LQIHFDNHKTSLYCSETRFGTAFQLKSSETIDNKGFQEITVLKHAMHNWYAIGWNACWRRVL